MSQMILFTESETETVMYWCAGFEMDEFCMWEGKFHDRCGFEREPV